MSATLALEIAETTDVADARRRAVAMAMRIGFDETESSAVAIVVTEMATNLVKHAVRGTVLVRILDAGEIQGIEVVAVDKGPGIADVALAMVDGASTAGTAGNGLGAIARMSAVFDAYSLPSKGTVLVAQIWPRQREPRTRVTTPNALTRVEYSGLCVPYPGEECCGDDWGIVERDGQVRIVIADGLGHGPLASEASARAREVGCTSRQGIVATLEDVHAALRATRGAAVAIADLDLDRGVIRYGGVGNTSGVVYAEQRSFNLVSVNGTAGHTSRRLQEFTYPWSHDSALVLYTDGLTSHCPIEKYAGLAPKHPSIIAGVMYRDCRRGRDDTTAVVVKEAAA